MNLIECTRRCRHQRDGCCTLDGAAPVAAIQDRDCCYFVPLAEPAENATKRDPKLSSDSPDPL